MKAGWIVTITAAVLLVAAARTRGQEPASAAPLVWEASAGPVSGSVNALVETESGTVFAFINSHIYRSTDDGVTWVVCPAQPQRRPRAQVYEHWLVTAGRRLYAAGDYGGPLYVTDDDCESSRLVPLPPGMSYQPTAITAVDDVLIAAYHQRMYRTSDEGRTWTPLPGFPSPLGNPPRLVRRGAVLWLAVSLRLYRSTDRGATWTAVAPDSGLAFHNFVQGGESFYATGSGGVLRSRDEGLTWTVVRPPPLTAIAARGERVYASVFSPAAIARSVDGGATWTQTPSPLPDYTSNVLFETSRGTVLAGTSYGIFRSTDSGNVWTATGLPGIGIRSLAATTTTTYASLMNGTLWSSADAGLTWSRQGIKFSGAAPQFGWPRQFSRLFLFDDGQMRAASDRELVASSDGGRTWSLAALSKSVTAITRFRDTWYAATSDGVFRSDDLARWTECSSGLAPVSPVLSLTATQEGELIAIQGDSTFTSQDECQSWWPIAMRVSTQGADGYYTMPQLFSDAALGTVLYGDGLRQWAAPNRTWIARAKTAFVTAFVRDGSGRYWLGTREGVRRLSTAGSEWSVMPAGLDGPVAALAVDPSGYLIAAIDDRGIFRARLP